MQDDDSGGSGGGELENGIGGNGYLDVPSSHHHQRGQLQRKGGKSLKLVMAAVGGMLLPLITQVGHAH